MRPVTDRQWQDAVDAAALVQMLAIAQLYGLITEDGHFDLEACGVILDDGRSRGITPRIEAVSRFVADFKEACDSVEQANVESPCSFDSESLVGAIK